MTLWPNPKRWHHSLRGDDILVVSLPPAENEPSGLAVKEHSGTLNDITGLNALRKGPKSLLTTQRTRKSRKFFWRNVGETGRRLADHFGELLRSLEGYNTTTLVFESLDNPMLMNVFLGFILNEKLVFVQIPFFFFYYKAFALAWIINLNMKADAQWHVMKSVMEVLNIHTYIHKLYLSSNFRVAWQANISENKIFDNEKLK